MDSYNKHLNGVVDNRPSMNTFTVSTEKETRQIDGKVNAPATPPSQDATIHLALALLSCNKLEHCHYTVTLPVREY